MSSEKPWLKSSDTSNEPSEIWKFVDIPRPVTSSQPEIKPIDFTHKIDENPIDINPVESFDSYIKRTLINSAKSFDLNLKDMSVTVRGMSDQASLAWELFTPDILRSRVISPKQNYVEFPEKL